jgi:hypothetical protein
MKFCSRCKRFRRLNSFSWRVVGKRKSNWCIRCYKTIAAAWYRDNKNKVKARTRNSKLTATLWLSAQKDAPCVDCGGKFHFAAMDFDHLRDKVLNPNQMANYGWRPARMAEELKKCELVCSNCHRVRTYKRRAVRAAKVKVRKTF